MERSGPRSVSTPLRVPPNSARRIAKPNNNATAIMTDQTGRWMPRTALPIYSWPGRGKRSSSVCRTEITSNNTAKINAMPVPRSESSDRSCTISPKQHPNMATRCRRQSGQGISPSAYCITMAAVRTAAKTASISTRIRRSSIPTIDAAPVAFIPSLPAQGSQLQPRQAEAVIGAIHFPKEKPDAQDKRNEEARNREPPQPGEVKDESKQQACKDRGHHRLSFPASWQLHVWALRPRRYAA